MEGFLVLLTFLLVASGFALLAVVAIFLISQSVHKDMTTSNGGVKEWGYGTFKDFQRELQGREIKRDPLWDNSLFGDGIYIHAGVISFDNKGMVLRGLSYLRFLLFMRSQRQIALKHRKQLWTKPDIKSVK